MADLKKKYYELLGGIKKSLTDNQGWIRQGKLTPVKQISEYFNPESSGGNNFWSTSVAKGLAKTQQAIPKPIQQFSQGFGNTSSYGLVDFKPQESPTLAYRVGQVAGLVNPINPISKGMTALNVGGKIVSKVAPKAVGIIPKIAGGLVSEGLQTGAYAGASALGSKLGINEQKDQFKPKNLASNLAIGSAFRGAISPQVSAKVANLFKDRLPDIDPADKKVMEEFINYARLKKKGTQSLKLEEYASTIAEQYGLKMPKTVSGLANEFDNVLTKIRKRDQEWQSMGFPKMGIVSEGKNKVTETKAPAIKESVMPWEEPSYQALSKTKINPSAVENKIQTQVVKAKPAKVSSINNIAPEEVSKIQKIAPAKVNLLDYFRTPDRVLKKMGMEKESEGLKTAYNNYLDQLPKEIDKITGWYNQVKSDPTASQRIFNYLDGQSVQLNKTETKVAGEIKKYLGEWADKLDLPDDKRMTNYITHIFEKDFIKKDFDEDLAKIISEKVAGSVYDPFTQERLGKQGYVEDVFRALDAYVKRATRKVNMDPALESISKKSNSLPLESWNYVKSYIDRVNLRPTEIDTMIDNLVKQSPIGYKLGARPVTSTTRQLRQAVYRGTLGLNVGSAIRNLTQGVNTYAKLGEKWTAKGYFDAFKSIMTNGDELSRVGVLRDTNIQD